MTALVFVCSASAFDGLDREISRPNGPNERFEITEARVGDTQIEFSKTFRLERNWLKDLTVSFRNKMSKTIVSFNVEILFPETRAGGRVIAHDIECATPLSAALKGDRTTTIPVNEVVSLKVDENEFAKLKAVVERRQPLDSLTKAEIRVTFIYFADETAFDGTALVRDPENATGFIYAPRTMPVNPPPGFPPPSYVIKARKRRGAWLDSPDWRSPVSLETLVSESKLIAIGHIQKNISTSKQEWPWMTTDYQVKIQQVIKGDAPTDPVITVLMPGGMITDSDGVLFSAVTPPVTMMMNQRYYIIFLKPSEWSPTGYSPVRGSQGIFEIPQNGNPRVISYAKIPPSEGEELAGFLETIRGLTRKQ